MKLLITVIWIEKHSALRNYHQFDLILWKLAHEDTHSIGACRYFQGVVSIHPCKMCASTRITDWFEIDLVYISWMVQSLKCYRFPWRLTTNTRFQERWQRTLHTQCLHSLTIWVNQPPNANMWYYTTTLKWPKSVNLCPQMTPGK